ncbi:MAG: Mur ligase family protein [Burkholderiales bacterium]
MKLLHDLRVLVLGLGDSGLAMARWAQRCGASRIVVADTRAAPPQAAQLAADVPGAELRCGAFDASLLDGMQLVLKSPGLSPLDAQVAPLLDAAAERGLLVLGELALFAHALRDLKAERGYAPKVLAITGTNGKTTTTAMTALLVERCGLRVAMAGNIGPTMLDTLAAALDLEPDPVEAIDVAADAAPAEAVSAPDEAAVIASEAQAESAPEVLLTEAADDTAAAADAPAEPATDDPFSAEELAEMGGGPPAHLIPSPPPPPVFGHLPEAWVLELSSFQLDGVSNFDPTAAVVLNVTQDHLDWHGDMAAYAAAKARVFGKSAVMIINRDDRAVEAMVPEPIIVKGRMAKPVQRKVVRFGLNAPQQPGDFGLEQAGGMAWLVRAHETDESIKRKPKPPTPRGGAGDLGRPGVAWGDDDEITLQRLMPADALRIRGRHNAANALAALALATAAGLPLAPMLHGLREYAGEPHRVEFLRSVRGIEAFDDSKGTNVGATVAALTGLGADKAPAKLVVILGGDGKGQDFGPLAAPVARFARAVATLGRDAAAIEAVLARSVDDLALPLQRHETLEAATRWSFDQAQPGDAVLLSPACASLDMFRNYAHRAQVFADTVAALAEEAGEMA